MFRDGRWFWWVFVGCLGVVGADVASLGPFAEPERRQEVEVLGESVEREPLPTTTTTEATTAVQAPITTDGVPAEDDLEGLEGLEDLRGMDRETLEQLAELDLENLETTTTLRGEAP